MGNVGSTRCLSVVALPSYVRGIATEVGTFLQSAHSLNCTPASLTGSIAKGSLHALNSQL